MNKPEIKRNPLYTEFPHVWIVFIGNKSYGCFGFSRACRCADDINKGFLTSK